MADTRQSLFGPSPEEVAMMQSQQGQQDAMGWAQLPAGRGAVAAGAMAGQALGGIAGRALGGQDPMQAKAQKLQAAQQEAEAQAQSMGINLASNPKDYYKVAAQTLQKYGLIDEAQNVMNIAQNHDIVERKMRVDEGTLGVQRTAAEAAMLKAQQGKNPTTSNILTLVPGNSTTKGAKGAVTIDMTDPTALQQARALQAQGYIDADSLPSPANPQNPITIMNPGEKNFLEKAADKSAEDIFVQRKTVRAVPEVIDKAQRTLAILEDPNLYVGPGSDIRLGIARGLNILGADNSETITKTDNLVSGLADQTLSMIETSGLGTGQGFTQNDRDYLERARSGKISLTKETIAEIARRSIKGQRYFVQNWNDTLATLPPARLNDLKGLGVNVDPVPLPEIPTPKKYKTKEQVEKNIPAGIRPDVWNVMTPEQKALFK